MLCDPTGMGGGIKGLNTHSPSLPSCFPCRASATMPAIDSLLPHFKYVTTSRGLTYSYYLSVPNPGKPTVLLVHGFPSLAVDWYPQITHFKQLGYGLIVPDQLGYGGTDKPKESSAYVHSLLAKDMVDILDHEKAENVVAIGHDWCASHLPTRARVGSLTTRGLEGARRPSAFLRICTQIASLGSGSLQWDIFLPAR